jgi:hypothetical protein
MTRIEGGGRFMDAIKRLRDDSSMNRGTYQTEVDGGGQGYFKDFPTSRSSGSPRGPQRTDPSPTISRFTYQHGRWTRWNRKLQ